MQSSYLFASSRKSFDLSTKINNTRRKLRWSHLITLMIDVKGKIDVELETDINIKSFVLKKHLNSKKKSKSYKK